MTTGFVAGTWDLLHTGHILMFEEVRNYCDFLLVGLHVDPSLERPLKNKPIQTLFERMVQLQACRFVDEIIVYETEKELELILTSFIIDVRFLDEKYLQKQNEITGYHLCPIHYNKRRHDYSTTNLRKKIINNHIKERDEFIK